MYIFTYYKHPSFYGTSTKCHFKLVVLLEVTLFFVPISALLFSFMSASLWVVSAFYRWVLTSLSITMVRITSCNRLVVILYGWTGFITIGQFGWTAVLASAAISTMAILNNAHVGISARGNMCCTRSGCTKVFWRIFITPFVSSKLHVRKIIVC